MNNSQNELTVLVHLPKTGGAYFQDCAFLSFPRTPVKILNTQASMNLTKEQFTREDKEPNRTIASLTAAQKESILYVTSHNSYKGIHKKFNRAAKYITFLREPIARTLSLYNYNRHIWETYANNQKDLNKNGINCIQHLRESFLINNLVPSFDEWVFTRFGHLTLSSATMTQFFQFLGFVQEDTSREQLTKDLSYFYYVGVTKESNRDILYLFHQLGINRFSASENRSPRYVELSQLSPSTVQKIQEIAQSDFTLYEIARSMRQKFEKTAIDYVRITRSMERKKRIILPFEFVEKKIKQSIKAALQYCGLSIKRAPKGFDCFE